MVAAGSGSENDTDSSSKVYANQMVAYNNITKESLEK